MQLKDYVAGGAEFLDPQQHQPPAGVKVLLLTPGGVCVVGHWDDWFIAWHPLPKVPAHLKSAGAREGRNSTPAPDPLPAGGCVT